MGMTGVLLAPETASVLRKYLTDAGDGGARIVESVGRISGPDGRPHEYEGIALAVSRAAASSVHAASSTVNHRVLAIAALLLRPQPRVSALKLPDSIVPFFHLEIKKISEHILRDDPRAYPSDTDDAFIKDARFATGYSIPCGAQSVEMDDQVRLRSLLKHFLLARDPRPLMRLGTKALDAMWFGIHTDSRDVSEFNERGWVACYRRIGELLERHPSVAGVVGTSWFFDPQVLKVSPRLGYLQRLPLENGAIAIRNGPGAVHTERATATSETRRRLFEQGNYTPVCFTIAWPRTAILEWCDKGDAPT